MADSGHRRARRAHSHPAGCPGRNRHAGPRVVQSGRATADARSRATARQAQAQLLALRSDLKTRELSQEAAIATLHAEAADAQRRAAANAALLNKSFIAPTEAASSEDRREELEKRMELENRRLQVFSGSNREQVAAMVEQVQRLKAVADFRRQQVDSLR